MTKGGKALWLAAAGAGGLGALALYKRRSRPEPAGSGAEPASAAETPAPGWPAALPPARFVWPVPLLLAPVLRKPLVTSGYHMRGKRFHWGVDILYRRLGDEPARLPHGTKKYYMPRGIPALAAADGVVTISRQFRRGGGIRIDHGHGIATDYLHLESRLFGKGDRVRKGQHIGLIGYDTSRAIDLYHLHFNLRLRGKKIDPEPHLRRWSMVAHNPRTTAAVA